MRLFRSSVFGFSSINWFFHTICQVLVRVDSFKFLLEAFGSNSELFIVSFKTCYFFKLSKFKLVERS